MEKINYIKNGVKGSEFIPQDYENLKRLFEDPNVVLINNEGWLANFDNKEVNVFELQKVLFEVNDLPYYDLKKLESMIEEKQPETLNEVIRLINNMKYYVLIRDFEVYFDNTRLAQEIYYQMEQTQHPDKSYDFEDLGHHIRQNYTTFFTKKGWLIEIIEPSQNYDRNEILQVHKPSELYEFEVKLENQDKHTTIKLPIPKDRLTIEIDLLNLGEYFDFEYIENKHNNNSKFYNRIETTILSSDIHEVNDFAGIMQGLSSYELETLMSVLEVVETNTLGEITYLVNSLNAFELIDGDTYQLDDYVKDKLQGLFAKDAEEFYEILDKYFNYADYYKDLQKDKTIVRTSRGLLKVDEALEPLINQEQGLSL